MAQGSSQSALSDVDLFKVITPHLLESVRKIHLPWPEDEPIDFTAVIRQYFEGDPNTAPQFYDLTFERALKPISTIGIENMPDLMQFLPPVEAKDFPAKALGLLLLLDQAPRALLTGLNQRWIYSYFDALAIKLTRQLYALPHAQRPDSIDRLMTQGWGFDYSIIARIWFVTPLVHSESLEDQNLQTAVSEEIRTLVENHVGRTDPYRSTVDKDSKDIYAFPRIALNPPTEDDTQIDDFIFWMLRLLRVHTPVVRTFGHYPYRNNSVGRISTKEEIQYAEDTDYFSMLTDDKAVKRIREDVEAGIWTPLQDEKRLADLEAKGA